MLKLGQKVSKNYTVSEVINTPERIKEIFSNNNPNEKVGIVTKSGKLRLIGEAFLFNKICGKDPVKAEEVRNKWIQTFIDRGCFMAVKGDVVEEDKGGWCGASITSVYELSKEEPKEEVYIDELKGKWFKCLNNKSFAHSYMFTTNKHYEIKCSSQDKVVFFADNNETVHILKECLNKYFSIVENTNPTQPEEEIIIEEPVNVTPNVNPFNNETEYLFAQKNPEYDTKKENVYDRKISIEAWALALNLIMVVIGVISFYFMAQLPLWFWIMLISVDIVMNVVLIVLHRKIK